MRGAVAELRSPHPLGHGLPAIYLTDAFTQRLCEGFDEVVAPVLSTLDNMAAYLDLSTTPDDLIPWLGHWVGMSVDPGQRPARQRELLRSASLLHGWQGTRRGIELVVEALFGLRTEVIDSGGAVWSTDPQDPLPGEPVPAIVVRVYPEAAEEVDEARLDAVVEAVKPAHVMHRVQVAAGQPPD
jgi:phage tail-like protein